MIQTQFFRTSTQVLRVIGAITIASMLVAVPLRIALAAQDVALSLSTTVTSPTSTSTIPVVAHFDSSVNGFIASDITVSNGSVSNFAGAGADYTFTVTPTTEGTTSISVVAGVASSSVGHDSMASNVINIVIDRTNPIISNVTTGSTDASSTVVSWDTNENTDAQVSWGLTTALGSSTALFDTGGSMGMHHMATLSGLSASTTYHFSVQSKDGAGNTATSSDMTFTTASTTPPAPVVLAVNGIDTVNGVATPDNVFADGWKWVFHLTVPDTETQLRMKFSDFALNSNASTTIPAGSNIRFFSSQSSTATSSNSAVTIGAANTYSGALTLSGDTSTTTAGRQVDVTVEMRIPEGTAQGAYTASYGIQTTP